MALYGGHLSDYRLAAHALPMEDRGPEGRAQVLRRSKNPNVTIDNF
jgi:hypothetical protein